LRFRHTRRATDASRPVSIGGVTIRDDRPPDARTVECDIRTQRCVAVEAPPEMAIALLAGGQHGVVARRQLLELGFSPEQIGRRIRRGSLHVVQRGVYAAGHPAISIRGDWLAAVLTYGADSVLSHRSAGALWGIVSPVRGLTEVTCTTRWRARRGITVHRASMLGDEISRVEGIPTTGVSRTLFDLASVLSRERLERAMDEAEVLELTDRISLHVLLERYPRRRGTAILRAILDDAQRARGVTRRELERRFAAALASTDLSRPHRNADVAVAGRFFEVDCLWRAEQLIVELDGGFVHGTWRASERDRERDRLLMVDGWRVVRITRRQLRDDAPAVVADLRKLLRQ
jgi:very-short-patch-repair endonuclease